MKRVAAIALAVLIFGSGFTLPKLPPRPKKRIVGPQRASAGQLMAKVGAAVVPVPAKTNLLFTWTIPSDLRAANLQVSYDLRTWNTVFPVDLSKGKVVLTNGLSLKVPKAVFRFQLPYGGH